MSNYKIIKKLAAKEYPLEFIISHNLFNQNLVMNFYNLPKRESQVWSRTTFCFVVSFDHEQLTIYRMKIDDELWILFFYLHSTRHFDDKTLVFVRRFWRSECNLNESVRKHQNFVMRRPKIAKNCSRYSIYRLIKIYSEYK